jgi:mRNA-degrading endonuclease YafQ of YafQ-DinJ toxin-antitoxin module
MFAFWSLQVDIDAETVGALLHGTWEGYKNCEVRSAFCLIYPVFPSLLLADDCLSFLCV